MLSQIASICTNINNLLPIKDVPVLFIDIKHFILTGGIYI